jgi:membrane protease YdiL (CAAX protease family)
MLPEKPWKPEAVLLLGGGVCLCLLAGMAILGGLGWLFPGLDKPDKNLLTFVVGAIFFQGAILAWIFVFLRWHEVGWIEAFGFSASASDVKRVLGWGSLGLLVVLPAAFLLGKLAELVLVRLGVSPEVQLAVKMLQQKPSLGQLVVYGTGAVLLAPVAEEMLFRGILYPALKQSGHRQLALWVSALLFASTHMNLMAFLPLTFLALVLAWLYERTANLLAPILTHLLFNAVNFTLLVVQPPWLNLK